MTITSMQFGQSAINVVLNEGQMPAKLSTDASGNTVLVGADQTIQLLGRGPNIVAVASVAEIVEAMADLTPLTTRFTQTAVITATNGSATVTGVSTSWSGTNKVAVGDLWKPDAGSRYYKIKFVISDTELTLYEPYQGTTISAASTAFTFFYYNRYNLVMAPGEYTVVGASAIALKSGFDFTALDAYATAINEGQSSPAGPFTNLGDNNFTNIRWAPTNAFGAMDRMFVSINSSIHAGARASFNRCIINATNKRDIHAGGPTNLPLLAAGTTTYNQCEFEQDHAPFWIVGGAVTATNANTIAVMNDCIHRRVEGTDTKAMMAWPGLLNLSNEAGTLRATFDIHNPKLLSEDFGISTSAGDVAAINVMAPVVLNLTGGRTNLANISSGGNLSVGVDIYAAATVNITGHDLEVSGTSSTGLRCVAGANATVNVRTGTRIKGGTNSLNITAGSTVNVSGNADLIGATTGAGTINLNTAT